MWRCAPSASSRRLNAQMVLEIAQIETTRAKLLRSERRAHPTEAFGKAVLKAIEAWREAVLLAHSRATNYALAYLLLLCVTTGDAYSHAYGLAGDEWRAFRDARAQEAHKALLLALEDASATDPSTARVHYRLFRLHYHLAYNKALPSATRTVDGEQARLHDAVVAQQHLERAVASSPSEVDERLARHVEDSAFAAWCLLRDIELTDAATRSIVARVCASRVTDITFKWIERVLFPPAPAEEGVVPPLADLALRATVAAREQRATALLLELCSGAKTLDLGALSTMLADPAAALAASSPLATSVTLAKLSPPASLIQRWSALESLDVSDCPLSPEAAAAIGALTSLRSLRLRHIDDATDALVRAAIERPPLTLCDVSRNVLSSALLDAVPTSVTVLRIGGTAIDDVSLRAALANRLSSVAKLDAVAMGNVRDLELFAFAATHAPLRYVRSPSGVPLWWVRDSAIEMRSPTHGASARAIREIYFGNEVALEVRHVRTFAGLHQLQLVARSMFPHFEQGELGDTVTVFEYTRSTQGVNKIELQSKMSGERVSFATMVGVAGVRGSATLQLHGRALEVQFSATPVNVRPGRVQTSVRENGRVLGSFDTIANKFDIAPDSEVVTTLGVLVAAELIGKAL
jgi:hypothetical protein